VSSHPPLLEACGIERRFGAARVLQGVDLVLRAGEVHVIAGPNGAGKTTLLRILAGLMRPTAGSVRVLGRRLADRPEDRRLLGLLSHQSCLYGDLTPRENLTFAARLYQLPAPAAAAESALMAMGLGDRLDDPVRRLSRGMVQRVAIARALLHRPRVLLLDEPFTGLDAASVRRMQDVLHSQQAEGNGMVLVTHALVEVWPLATRVSVLVRGRWVMDEPRPEDRDGFVARYHEALGD
jgi:heme exporter protein A